MKQKSPQEEKAAIRQVQLINEALTQAKTSGGAWLNPKGMLAPKIYPKGPSVSPFNALILQLDTDKQGYASSQYVFFHTAKAIGEPVKEKERGVPFNWYDWSKYVSKTDPEKVISKDEFKALPEAEQAGYKAVRDRQIRMLFNAEQTLFPLKNPEKYQKSLEWCGTANDRGNIRLEEKQLRAGVNGFINNMKQYLVPIRREPSEVAHYDSDKDAVYMPDQKKFATYPEYVQELMRQVVNATGHQQRLAREGMVMKGGQAPSEDAVKYEKLVVEVASALKMSQHGLPAQISPQNIELVDYWTRELQENPCMIDALEADVNNAHDVIRQAEQGQKVEYARFHTQAQIDELKEAQKPEVDSADCVILADIIRHSGMAINDGNFQPPEEKAAFLQKFNLYSYDKALNEALAMTNDPDPEVREAAWTEAQTQSARIMEACMEYLPDVWNSRTNHYVISEGLSKDVPREHEKEMLVVRDTKTGIVDVVLPGGAMVGGYVVLPEGERKLYRVTPDEVMSADERKEAKASLQTFDYKGFSKARIENALRKTGATYVRFYNMEGKLSLRTDDAWYEGKTASAYRWKDGKLTEATRFDLSEAVKNATEVLIDRALILKDDNGKWALYIKPKDEPSFSVYPERDDVNRFFSTLRQGNQTEADRLRMELGQKYYHQAKTTPQIKFDIFGGKPAGVDVSQISRVSLYKNREDKLMCAIKVEGMDYIQAREISKEQFSRMFVAEDMGEYKTNLAAQVFEDILNPEKKQAEDVDNAQEEAAHVDFHKEQNEDHAMDEQAHRDFHESEDRKEQHEEKEEQEEERSRGFRR